MKRLLIALFGVLVCGAFTLNAWGVSLNTELLIQRMRNSLNTFTYGVSSNITKTIPNLKVGLNEGSDACEKFYSPEGFATYRFSFPARDGGTVIPLRTTVNVKWSQGDGLGESVNISLHKVGGEKVMPDLGLRKIENTGGYLIDKKKLRTPKTSDAKSGQKYFFKVENAQKPEIYVQSACFAFVLNPNRFERKALKRTNQLESSLEALDSTTADLTRRIESLETLVDLIVVYGIDFKAIVALYDGGHIDQMTLREIIAIKEEAAARRKSASGGG